MYKRQLMIRRSGKVAEPTRAGEIFADNARQIIPLYEGCLKQLNVRPETRRRHLRIGVPPHQGNLIMSALMSYTDGPLKDMELEFSEAPADAHESSLVNGAIDLAIIRLPCLLYTSSPYFTSMIFAFCLKCP